MKIGTTSYAFRYLLAGSAGVRLGELVARVRGFGLEAFQVCENARPLEAPEAEWRETIAQARDSGVELQLGAMTLRVDTLRRYLERAAMIPSGVLRIVLEEEGGGKPGSLEIRGFLDAAMPALEASGIALAIENHFDIPCRLLAEAAAGYPKDRVGFCVDSANSLRNFEPPDQVMDLLGPRAMMFHLKDYRIRGSNVGFSVEGAPLGQGDLDVAGFLARVFAHDSSPSVFLENWAPPTGDFAADVETDARWLRESLSYLRDVVARKQA